MINYSIIIPHKNIPQLLQRCLDSIPRREDVQIIVVDDNSGADKVDFAIFPGINDPYVEVIFGKNENGRKGAGYARNLGLERAKGKWLIFADADDFFMPCFNEILDKYINNENDIIYFNITSVFSDTLLPANRHEHIIRIFNEVQKTGNFDVLFDIETVYGKIIKRNLVEINNIQFKEYIWSNDVYFAVKCGVFADKKIVTYDVVYCLTVREGSLEYQHTSESLKVRFFASNEAALLLKKHIRKEGGKFRFSGGKIRLLWWWDEIFDRNKKEAFFLLPYMISTCGVRFVYKKIIIPKIKRKIK